MAGEQAENKAKPEKGPEMTMGTVCLKLRRYR